MAFYSVKNNSGLDLQEMEELLGSFMPFSKKRMGYDRPVEITFESDASNGGNILGKTAFYDPSSDAITVYTDYRHPKDMMRSLSHELVHHTQNCKGDLNKGGEVGEGYAQKDEHLREMERQAYEVGNMCFRDWEDTYKHDLATNYNNVGAIVAEKKERLFGLLTKKIIKENLK